MPDPFLTLGVSCRYHFQLNYLFSFHLQTRRPASYYLLSGIT